MGEQDKLSVAGALRPTRQTEDEVEWSLNIDFGQREQGQQPRRLYVKVDDDIGAIEIEECDVTSERDTAEKLTTGSHVYLMLDVDDARWLARAIDAAVATKARRGIVDLQARLAESRADLANANSELAALREAVRLASDAVNDLAMLLGLNAPELAPQVKQLVDAVKLHAVVYGAERRAAHDAARDAANATPEPGNGGDDGGR